MDMCRFVETTINRCTVVISKNTFLLKLLIFISTYIYLLIILLRSKTIELSQTRSKCGHNILWFHLKLFIRHLNPLDSVVFGTKMMNVKDEIYVG